MEGITISGLDDCLKLFDQAPANLVEVSRTALKDASKVTTRQIRGRLPKRWRGMVRYKVMKTYQKGDLHALLGLFNGHQRQGHQNKAGNVDDWFKAYWLNYGTLSKRDPEHQFRTPVKHRGTAAAARRKFAEGIEPRKFFEASIKGWQGTFVEAFGKSIKNQEDKLYER